MLHKMGRSRATRRAQTALPATRMSRLHESTPKTSASRATELFEHETYSEYLGALIRQTVRCKRNDGNAHLIPISARYHPARKVVHPRPARVPLRLRRVRLTGQVTRTWCRESRWNSSRIICIGPSRLRAAEGDVIYSRSSDGLLQIV